MEMEIKNHLANQKLLKHLNALLRLVMYGGFAWAGSFTFPVVLVEIWRIPDQTGVILFNVFVVSQLFYVFQDREPMDMLIMMGAGAVVYLLFCGGVVWLLLLVPDFPDYERGIGTAVVLFAVAFVASDIGGDVAEFVGRFWRDDR